MRALLKLLFPLIVFAADGLKVEVKRDGDCSEGEAEPGSKLKVHYKGYLSDGAEFENSIYQRPFEFTLGAGRVIPGWEIGLDFMCVGEIRKLVIEPHLAYGAKGSPPTIPPNETLTFEIVLLEVTPRPDDDDDD